MLRHKLFLVVFIALAFLLGVLLLPNVISQVVSLKANDPQGDYNPEAGALNIKRVLTSLGYSSSIANRLTISLLPIYEKMHFRDINNSDSLQEDLKQNINIIYNEVWGDTGIRALSRKHVQNFELLLNDTQHARFLERMSREYCLLLAKDKEMFMAAFQCSYHSYLGWILLTAKGLEVLPVSSVVFPDYLWKQSKGKEEFNDGNLLKTRPGKVALRSGHVALIVKLSGSGFIFVDMVNTFVSQRFSSDDYFCDKGLANCELWGNRKGNAFTRIQFLDKKYFRAIMYGYLANFYSVFREEDNAVKVLEQAITLAPGFDYVYHQAGIYYAMAGDIDKAIVLFKRGYFCNPYNDRIEFSLGTAYLVRHDYAQGVKYLAMAVQVYPNDPLYLYQLGIGLANQDRYGEAVDFFDKAGKIDPQYPGVQLAKANVLALAGLRAQESGDRDTAREDLSESLELYGSLNETSAVHDLRDVMRHRGIFLTAY